MSTEVLRIGRYSPLALLGEGRLLATFRARADDGDAAAASPAFILKVLRHELCGPTVVARFLDTVRRLRVTSLSGLSSPVEVGEGPGPVFAAFVFNEGVNLAQLRAQAAAPGALMDVRLAGLLGRKVAERLSPLHAQSDGPRVHGALSPGNVLVRPNGDVLLLDCSLGEALRTGATWPSESWRYAAPEQLAGGPAEQASDLYALGALLYFLCLGRPPFGDATSPPELLARIAKGTPDFSGLHPALAGCIGRLLAYEPGARPRTAGEVMRQISVALITARAGVTRVAAEAPAPAAPIEAAEPALAVEEASPASGEDDDGAVFAAFARTASALAARGAIAADDPDVGVVYDDEDDDEVEVGPDGKVKRRRRRAIRLLAWTKSELAKTLFRYAWVPLLVGLFVGGVEGYLFLRSWRQARLESQRRDAELAAERARLEAAKPKRAKGTQLPPGHLVVKINPSGAVVWIDGSEAGTAPSTMLTQPGAHRIVITAPGYHMLRDVVDTSRGAVIERDLAPAVFPLTGAVGVNVACTTEGKYPVFVDGREIGALCPIAGIRLDPGKHMVGIFVIPQNRVWSVDREIVPERPHRVQFNY